MNYESFDTPVFILGKAASKLNQYGMDVFEMYANENNISFCDRNRAIVKCKIAYNRPGLKELPCPDNLMQERLRFYTRRMGYDNKTARGLLAKIDKAYENQFTPNINIKRMASGIG